MDCPGHVSVLVAELLKFLNPKPDRIYLDATLGAGGHARAVLEKAGPTAKLIAFDQDPEALTLAQKNLAEFSKQIVWIEANFGDIRNVLTDHKIKKTDGIYADLGLSSMQLANAARGFSFQTEGPLDMRMSPKSAQTVLTVLRDLSEEDLADVLYRYGEERMSRKISRWIKEALAANQLQTTTDLAELVRRAYPPKLRRGRIHPATRTFQALRIYVNGELGQLEKFLDQAPELLNLQGVLAVMSYHSLEDRLVKQKFRALAGAGFELLTKKPVTPTAEEVQKNSRSRSAKLRGIRKL